MYAVSSGSSKGDLAKTLGAHEHVDSSKVDVVEYFQALGGAKLIICTAPYSAQISAIIPAVGRNGTITLVSAATDGKIEVMNLLLNMNRATLRGWSCGANADTEECIKFSTLAGVVCPFPSVSDCGTFFFLVFYLDVKSMVKTFSLDEFSEAYRDLITGRPQFRNVIVFSN